MTEPAKKRRTKADIEEEKRQKLLRAEERQKKRLDRMLAEAPEMSARAARTMEAELRKEKDRERRRQLFEDMTDYAYGRDTPGADRIKAMFAGVSEAKKRAAAAGDPMNITGHTPPPTPKALKSLAKVRRKAAEKRFTSLVTHEGQRVKVDLKTNPIAGIYRSGGISTPQFAAAAEFQRDFDQSQYSGMRCRGFEPGVDGGKAAVVNLDAVAAQRKLAKLKDKIGAEKFMLMEAVIGMKITFSQISDASGVMNSTISQRLREALNETAVFYGLQKDAPESKVLKALQALLSDIASKAGEFVR